MDGIEWKTHSSIFSYKPVFSFPQNIFEGNYEWGIMEFFIKMSMMPLLFHKFLVIILISHYLSHLTVIIITSLFTRATRMFKGSSYLSLLIF